jgi:DUF4097 and DUF4098 domain-containing protein YvlB
MKVKSLRALALSTVFLMMTGLSVSAQDFTRTFTLGPEGVVKIKNISGDVTVSGYEGEVVVVKGFKEGRDRDKVQVVDNSDANRIDLSVSYPNNCDCDASIRFEVQVPASVKYRFESISSVSGNVSVSGVAGTLKARAVSGNVTIKHVSGVINASSTSGNVEVVEIAGSVTGKSTSGNVNVSINKLSGTEEMDFASTSGNVQVKLPGSLDATVEMSVLSGDLRTDFPLNIEKKENGPGQRATGQVGGGSRKLTLRSISGNVELLRL